MNDAIKSEIHGALRVILGRLDRVGVTLATEERGTALVATISFRRPMVDGVTIQVSGVYSAPITINGNSLPKLSHCILRRIQLAIYCNDVPDVFLLEKVVSELANAFLRTEGSPFGERALLFALRKCPICGREALTMFLHFSTDWAELMSIGCEEVLQPERRRLVQADRFTFSRPCPMHYERHSTTYPLFHLDYRYEEGRGQSTLRTHANFFLGVADCVRKSEVL